MDAFINGVKTNGFEFELEAFKRAAVEEGFLGDTVPSVRQTKKMLAALRWVQGFFKTRGADRSGFLMWWACFSLLLPI